MIYNDDEFKKRLCSYCKKREKIDFKTITYGHNDCRICVECLGKISKIDNCLDCGNLIERLDLTRLAYVRCVLEGCNKNIPENLMEIHQNLCKKKSAQIISEYNQELEVLPANKEDPSCETNNMMILDNSTPTRDESINHFDYNITVPKTPLDIIKPMTQDKEILSSKNEDEKPQLQSQPLENTPHLLQSELDIFIKKMNIYIEFVENQSDKIFFFKIKNKKHFPNLGIIFGFELAYRSAYISDT